MNIFPFLFSSEVYYAQRHSEAIQAYTNPLYVTLQYSTSPLFKSLKN